jgi:hypothetical protein
MLQYFRIHVCLFNSFKIQEKVLVLVVYHSVPLECGPNVFTGAKDYEGQSYPTTTLWETTWMMQWGILDAFEGDNKLKALRKSPPQVVDFFVILIFIYCFTFRPIKNLNKFKIVDSFTICPLVNISLIINGRIVKQQAFLHHSGCSECNVNLCMGYYCDSDALKHFHKTLLSTTLKFSSTRMYS